MAEVLDLTSADRQKMPNITRRLTAKMGVWLASLSSNQRKIVAETLQDARAQLRAQHHQRGK